MTVVRCTAASPATNKGFLTFFTPYPEELLDHESKPDWEVCGLKSKKLKQWWHEYMVFVICFHIQLWIKGKIGDCELAWEKKWRESRRKRNGVGKVHDESMFWGTSAINKQKISGTGILVSLLGTQAVLVTRASTLLVPIGSVPLPWAGFAEEGRKGMTNYIASWIDFINAAKKNTAVRRPQ